MILRTPSFYKDFKCIAGACPDSCCQGWEVDADWDTLSSYSNLTGEIKNRIDSVLDKDEFGNTVFRLADKKRCPFLNNDNLCDIHIAVGQEYTPYTCRTFPRFINDFGGTREMGVSFSCPVAADMMYALEEPMSFKDELIDEPPTLNEIDAQTYYYLTKARKKAFEIIRNSQKPVSQRLIELLDYGVEIQQDLEEYEPENDMTEFFDVFKNPELINPQWTEKVNNGSIKPVENKMFYVNIASYFIYRYFLTAVYDYDVLSKIKMAVVGVLVAVCFGDDSWTMHLWSKETEHSQYNMDRYRALLKNAKCLSAESLKKLLQNE